MAGALVGQDPIYAGPAYPLTQAAYAYTAPRHAVSLELRLRGLTVARLHGSAASSVAEFLLAVQRELSQAEGQRGEPISILGVFGRYAMKGEEAQRAHCDEEVVVMFQASTVHSDSVDQVVERLQARMAQPDPQGKLASQFGFTLQNASVALVTATPGPRVGPGDPEGIRTMGSVALPIGVSAAFTGVLIWLAAW